MANVAIGNVHVDAALTNYSVGYRYGDLIADFVMPRVPVTKESDIYYLDDTSELNVDNNGLRAPGAPPNEFVWTFSTAQYLCHEYEKAYFLPARVRANADEGVGIEQKAILKPTKNLKMLLERRVAAIAAATSNVATPTTNWDQADATIESDVNDAKQAIHDAIGIDPNIAFCDIKVAREIVAQADIREILKYTRLQDPKSLLHSEIQKIIDGLFDLKWYIAGQYYNTANQGQTASLSAVWGTAVYFAYVDPGASMLDPTWAKQFVSQDFVAKRWTVDGRNGEYFEVSHVVDEKETLAGALYKQDAVI
jgi:hypothetical protein